MADSSDIELTPHNGEILLAIKDLDGGVEIFLTPAQALKLIEGLADTTRQVVEAAQP